MFKATAGVAVLATATLVVSVSSASTPAAFVSSFNGLRVTEPMGRMPLAPTQGRSLSLGPRMVASPDRQAASWFAPGQKFGPQEPGQASPIEIPYDNFNLDKNKVEAIKRDGGHLRFPLKQEMADTETIDISGDSVVILKHHGSYMQQDRSLQKTDKEAYKQSYQFMLRLKVPCGKMDAHTYQVLDDLSTNFGQGDLRATTRQAWQLHGVKKHNLKHVIASIAKAGGSTLGGCGDINRNIMTPPAPLADKAYQYAFQASNYLADLLKPSSPAFLELWMDGQKTGAVEYWNKDLIHGSTGKNIIPPLASNPEELDAMITRDRLKDQGTGIITGDPEEPLYGRTYLPRKFKMAVTVPGDNSVDIFIHDIGLVVIMDEANENLLGYNVFVGGGMGRTHNKASTFAKVAEDLGFVAKEDVGELCKAILAAQRDHGNREVRANARLKYLVHTLGIENFRKLVEGYFGKKIEASVPLPEWRMVDWLGWHEQGDGDLFLGVNIEQGRVKDEGSFKLKTALRKIVDKYGIDTRLTGQQNVVLCGIKPKDKADIDAILKEHGVQDVSQISPMVRNSMACPAFPLCGLAQSEAERAMPEFNERITALLDKMGLPGEYFITRMTGCPNGCARPYMAELSFVGMGANQYQVWLGGSPNQDGRTGFHYMDRVKTDALEATLEPIFYMWKTQRTQQEERFGDFCERVGKDAILAFSESYTAGTAFKNVKVEALTPEVVRRIMAPVPASAAGTGTLIRASSGPRKQQIRVTDEIHQLLKSKAEERGVAMSDLVEDILAGSLK